jgi:glycosyltransferase involved in cell wall biosynthesis
MSRSKLLAVVHLPPPYHGASTMGEQFIHSMLLRDRYDMRIVNLTTSKSLLAKGWKALFQKLRQTIALQLHLLREVIFHRPDLVYVTANSCGPAFWKDYFVLLALKALNIKHCMHFHNKGFIRYDSTILGRFVLRTFFAKAHSIFLSELLLEDLPRTRKLIRYSICPNGIASVAALLEYESEKRELSILFISNLIREKGVYELLDACAILKMNGQPFQCYIVGASGDITEPDLQARIFSNQLSDQVHYHGPVFGKDKDGYYQNADIFVFPSYYSKECFPLVLLEAMSCGLPIVSTHEGGIPDIVVDGVNGFLCEKRNPQALAEKIQILLSDDTIRNKMRAANIERFENNFTKSHFERNMLACLKIQYE